MTRMKMAALLIFLPIFSFAQLDGATEEALIQKFTQVYLKLSPSDSAKLPVTLRLADLHSERARRRSMEDIVKGQNDRVKALQYYKEALPKLEESKQSRIWIQMGHLEELNGNDNAAIATYERALKQNQTEDYKAEAALSLGEMYFKKRNYSTARNYLTQAANSPKSTNPGLASYRVAWCDFNEGRTQAAIDGLVRILKTPELMARGPRTGGAAQVDTQFQEEVSRDLATFLVKRQVQDSDIQLVYTLSPESTKVTNVVHLAGEAERLGQLNAAIAGFRFSLNKQGDPMARLESHVHLAQLQAQSNKRSEAVRDYEMALQVWGENPCTSGDTCKELKVRLKNFVIDWNKLEKKSPSNELLAAYEAYNKVFAGESQMHYYSAIIAQDLKNYPKAFELYQKSALLGGESKEASLLAAIEVAELAKDAAMMNIAYDLYLKNSSKKEKTLEVQYQKARLLYDAQPGMDSAMALRAVALSSEKGDIKLKKQAADLALDALVTTKNSQLISQWSSEFSTAFPQMSDDFKTVSRKSTLNQVAELSKNDQNLAAAWAELAQFDLKTATPSEKMTYYKNRLILAEKMKKFREARDAAEQLLIQPNLTKEDQTYALSRKAWLAELVLDFDQALVATQKMPEDQSQDVRLLKLALYSDLAAKDPSMYYQKYLSVSKDEDKKLAIAAQLVKMAKEPLKEIEKNKAILAKKPELLGDLYLEVYAATRSPAVAKSVLTTPLLAKTFAATYLNRLQILDGLAALKQTVSAHQIDSSKQSKLAQTLKARVAMLTKLDEAAKQAIQSTDWTAQVVALDLVSQQNKRFYEEVVSLPMPAGLEPEQEQEYLSALSQQASPHMVKSQDAGKKVAELWAQSNIVAEFQKSLANQKNKNMAELLKREIKTVAEIAPEQSKPALTAMAQAPIHIAEAAKPDLRVLELARSQVRENPLSRQSLMNLIQVEKQAGRESMVSYLESRIQTLPSEEKTQ